MGRACYSKGMTNTPAPAPATDEQLAAAITRGLATGALVALADVDWDNLAGVELGPDLVDDEHLADRAPVDPYLARYGTPEQHDPATCGVCATLPRP